MLVLPPPSFHRMKQLLGKGRSRVLDFNSVTWAQISGFDAFETWTTISILMDAKVIHLSWGLGCDGAEVV